MTNVDGTYRAMARTRTRVYAGVMRILLPLNARCHFARCAPRGSLAAALNPMEHSLKKSSRCVFAAAKLRTRRRKSIDGTAQFTVFDTCDGIVQPQGTMTTTMRKRRSGELLVGKNDTRAKRRFARTNCYRLDATLKV